MYTQIKPDNLEATDSWLNIEKLPILNPLKNDEHFRYQYKVAQLLNKIVFYAISPIALAAFADISRHMIGRNEVHLNIAVLLAIGVLRSVFSSRLAFFNKVFADFVIKCLQSQQTIESYAAMICVFHIYQDATPLLKK